MALIPLKNKQCEIIDHTIVSPEDYDHLNSFKWYKDKENYVKSFIKDADGKFKSWRLHRYIMINILQHNITSKIPIDHINNNPLDNRRENLRIVTHSENSRNKKKKKNCTSKYIGVSKCKTGKWRVSIRFNCKRYQAYYEKETHAAYQYNIWIKELNIKHATFNNVNTPKNFIKWVSSKGKKANDLPIGVEKTKHNKFHVKIKIENKSKYIGSFNTIDEAIFARQKAEEEKRDYIQKKILDTLKSFNKHNQCIFKVKEEEIIIDEEMYYDIIIYKWHKRKNYYRSEIDGKTIGLSNYIMNYYGDDIIDHINNNVLDNRKENLRIVTYKQNAMNRSSRKNSLSKYVGVTKTNNKWTSYINVNNKKIYLGQFDDEIEAAKVRDIATKKYFGEYGNLNF